jgi:hypothetical protein
LRTFYTDIAISRPTRAAGASSVMGICLRISLIVSGDFRRS